MRKSPTPLLPIRLNYIFNFFLYMANVKKGIFNWHFLTKCNLNLPQPFWGVNLSLHPPHTAYPPYRSRSAGNRSLTSGVSSKCVIYIYKMKSTKQFRTMNLSRKDISGHIYISVFSILAVVTRHFLIETVCSLRLSLFASEGDCWV